MNTDAYVAKCGHERGTEAPERGVGKDHSLVTSAADATVSSRAVFVFVVEAGVAVFEGDFFAGHPEVKDFGFGVEDAAVTGEEGGFFALVNGTETIGGAGELGGVEGQCFQTLGFGQAEGDGLGGGIGEVLGQGSVHG